MPSVTEETFDRVRETFTRSPRKSAESQSRVEGTGAHSEENSTELTAILQNTPIIYTHPVFLTLQIGIVVVFTQSSLQFAVLYYVFLKKSVKGNFHQTSKSYGSMFNANNSNKLYLVHIPALMLLFYAKIRLMH
jgi:hypothetical protein